MAQTTIGPSVTSAPLNANFTELYGWVDQSVKQGATPSFNGIKFPASQAASADPNTLDDYEEGSWTPTIVGSSTPGTQTYSAQTGSYVKIGMVVFLWARVVLSSTSGAAGNILISGLPFANGAIGRSAAVQIRNCSNLTDNYNATLLGTYVSGSNIGLVDGSASEADIATAKLTNSTGVDLIAIYRV